MQGLNNVDVMRPVTKFSEEIPCGDAISEASGRPGQETEGVGKGAQWMCRLASK